MGDVPVQLVIAGSQDERGADAALDMLKQGKKERPSASKTLPSYARRRRASSTTETAAA